MKKIRPREIIATVLGITGVLAIAQICGINFGWVWVFSPIWLSLSTFGAMAAYALWEVRK